jgi:hypothetical protein
MEQIIRVNPTEAQKKLIAGKQSYKCANKPDSQIPGIQTYACPLWQKHESDNKGSFDESGFELDHIKELAISNDNSLDNFQALCKSCHAVKTKKFIMKRGNQAFHPLYGKYLFKQGDHYIYLADSITITKQSKIWSKNRPCDNLRVDEIKTYITKNVMVDGVIYFANLKDEGFVCYDGNHRREALKKINKNYKIIINVLEEPSPTYLRNKFISLNKCVPVTDLFLEEEPIKKNIINEIMEATNYFLGQWTTHRKTSPKPRRPNFNRDTLQEKIVEIMAFCGINIKENSEHNDILDSNAIIELVTEYNNELKDHLNDVKCSETQRAKCLASNCFLFLT